MIVEEFRLPVRRLPSTCGPGAALAIADGPSLAEYDLRDLQGCGATLCGYGRSAHLLQYEHYWLTDMGFVEVLESVPSIPHLHVCQAVLDLGGQRRAPHHNWELGRPGCTYHVAVEAARMFPKVFVLGVDGYFRSDGTLRHLQYASKLPETIRTRNPRLSYRNLDLLMHPEVRWQQNNSACLYMLENREFPVFNLGPSSAYALIWPTHPDVLAQPFGRIDRQGPCVIVDCTGRLPQGSSLSGWSATAAVTHRSYVAALRSQHPTLAICVRGRAEQLSELAEMFEGLDVLLGGSMAGIPSDALFSTTSTIFLPPIG
jgi:hypothetical protein